MMDDNTGTYEVILVNSTPLFLMNGTVYRSLYSHIFIYISI